MQTTAAPHSSTPVLAALGTTSAAAAPGAAPHSGLTFAEQLGRYGAADPAPIATPLATPIAAAISASIASALEAGVGAADRDADAGAARLAAQAGADARLDLASPRVSRPGQPDAAWLAPGALPTDMTAALPEAADAADSAGLTQLVAQLVPRTGVPAQPDATGAGGAATRQGLSSTSPAAPHPTPGRTEPASGAAHAASPSSRVAQATVWARADCGDAKLAPAAAAHRAAAAHGAAALDMSALAGTVDAAAGDARGDARIAERSDERMEERIEERVNERGAELAGRNDAASAAIVAALPADLGGTAEPLPREIRPAWNSSDALSATPWLAAPQAPSSPTAPALPTASTDSTAAALTPTLQAAPSTAAGAHRTVANSAAGRAHFERSEAMASRFAMPAAADSQRTDPSAAPHDGQRQIDPDTLSNLGAPQRHALHPAQRQAPAAEAVAAAVVGAPSSATLAASAATALPDAATAAGTAGAAPQALPSAAPLAASPWFTTPAAPAQAPAWQGELAVPVTSPQFRDAFALQVSVLARDGVQHAQVQLNPAELGPISVQIALDGAQAQIHFGCDSAQTRSLVEAGLPSLAAHLREAGLTLSGGGVSQHAPGPRQDSNSGSRDARRGAGEPLDAPNPAARTIRVAAGRLDTYA